MSSYDSLNFDDLLAAVPADRTAIVIPESRIRLSYASLRQQVHALNAPASSIDAVSRIVEGLALPSVTVETSGRTGPSKHVRLPRAMLIRSAAKVATSLSLGADDVSLCVMPMARVQGLVASALATLSTGGTVVVPTAFNPLAFWRIARDHRVTWFTATPHILQMLLARTAAPGLRRPAGAARVRLIRSSGAPLWKEIATTLESAFAAPVIEAYDVAEAGGQVASNPLPPAERRLGSVGRPDPAEVHIVDQAGNRVGADQEGEVVIQGLADGPFRTGDLGYLSGDGWLSIRG